MEEIVPSIPLVLFSRIYAAINIIPNASKRSKCLGKGMLAPTNIVNKKFPVPCIPVIKKIDLLL